MARPGAVAGGAARARGTNGVSGDRIGAPPIAAVLPDGRRRHFQHGPIDLVLEAFGERSEVQTAYDQAWGRFQTVLDELVAELPALRTSLDKGPVVTGPVAREMVRACAAHRGIFITPMAAVAGAVADAVLAAMTTNRRLDKAYVNNGGDIALFLAPGQALTTGLVTLGKRPAFDGFSRIEAASPVRGIATSGWRGRSFSMGIADSVTVLARTAAVADAAATLIANAVNIDDSAIRRAPATELAPDSDLGDRLVTVEVGPLPPEKVERALDRGAARASDMRRRGLIVDALLALQGNFRTANSSAQAPGQRQPQQPAEQAAWQIDHRDHEHHAERQQPIMP
jgi:uncharacterized protein